MACVNHFQEYDLVSGYRQGTQSFFNPKTWRAGKVLEADHLVLHLGEQGLEVAGFCYVSV